MGYDYLSEYQEITKLGNGARWWKVDLHVHSPGSHDFEDRSVNAREYVQALLDKGMDMVAVADHMTGEWVAEVEKAARALASRGRGKLTVLPATEVSASEGIHLVVILRESKGNESGSMRVDRILTKIGAPMEGRGKEGTLTNKSSVDVIEAVHDEGGLVVGAHAHSNNGVVGGLTGVAPQSVLQVIDVLELIVGQKNPQRTVDYVCQDLGFDLPFVRSTDAHSVAEFSDNTCWIKMGSCGFNGLKQICFEPELRIRLEPPPACDYPAILGLSTSGGIYAGSTFHFNDDLNVLIGGRAAGKSAAVDLIRWALGLSPWDTLTEKIFNGRIIEFLHSGDVVRLYVRGGEGKTFVIERMLDYVENREVKARFLGEPRVWQVLGDRVLEVDRPVREVFDIEIFGQGEVLELTKRADNQLKLIDDYIKAESVLKEERRILGLLENNRDSMLTQLEEVENLRQEYAERDEIEKRIKTLESELKAPVFRDHDLWDRERNYLDRVKTTLAEWAEQLETDKVQERTLPDVDMEATPNREVIVGAERLITETFEDLDGLGKEQGEAVLKAQTQLKELRDPWEAKLKEEDSAFRERLKELGYADLQALVNELSQKRDRLEELQSEVLPKLSTAETLLENLSNKWEELLEKLTEIREKLYSKREELVSGLTGALGGSVKVEIDHATNKDEYSRVLNDMYTGSGIQNRQHQLEKVVDSLMPRELADMIAAKDINGIIEATGVTPATADRLVNFPRPRQILDLQTCKVDDSPRILLKKEGEYEFTELDKLSFGEKCSAVLSIALLNKDKPLVIDQPEDEVDYAFRVENIVGSIKSVKAERQLLIATHDPNIPVLGDCELVLKVKKRPGVTLCEIEEQGALEERPIIHHLLLLEGGADAFERRAKKYGAAV